MEVILNDEREDLHGKEADIAQVIYALENGKLTKQLEQGGVIYYDDSPGHDHYHVDDWVEFKLYEEQNFLFWKKLELIAESRKVSFCLFDSGICDGTTSLCDIDNQRQGPETLTNYGMGGYVSCEMDRQGISVGGYDTYGYSYEGQYICLLYTSPSPRDRG